MGYKYIVGCCQACVWALSRTEKSKYLVVSQLRECVHNDTKDDVETNCGDENEESDVEEGFVEVVCERFPIRYFQVLEYLSRGYFQSVYWCSASYKR